MCYSGKSNAWTKIPQFRVQFRLQGAGMQRSPGHRELQAPDFHFKGSINIYITMDY